MDFIGPLVFVFLSPPPVLPLLEISHQSHVGVRPSSPSQWGESEADNDLGDNNRAEETKERWGEGWREDDREEVGGERSVFHFVSFAPQWLLSTVLVMSSLCVRPSYPKEEVPEKGHVFHQVSWGGDWRPPDVPQPLDWFHPVPLLLFAHNMERLRWYTQLHWICMEICAYISIHSPLISRLYMPLLSGLISKEKHISQELWPLLSKFTGNDKQHS